MTAAQATVADAGDQAQTHVRHGDWKEVRDRLFRAVDGAVDVDNINDLVARNKLTREGLDPATARPVREGMERAAAQRLQPHHIQSFFEAAFAQAGDKSRLREKGRFEVTRVPPVLRNRDRLIGRAEPRFNEERRSIAVESIKQAVKVELD